MNLHNAFMRRYMAAKHRSVQRVLESPHEVQKHWFNYIIEKGKKTKIGRELSFGDIMTPKDFAEHIPIHTYEDTWPYIQRAMQQESDVLWPGKPKWFSQSSGTTNSRSKYIPVTEENLTTCHIKGFTDALSIIYNRFDDANVFAGQSVTMAGSMRYHEEYPQAYVGDVSAIILSHMPLIGKPFYALDKNIAFNADWEEKLEQSAQYFISKKNITLFGGVPTWNIVLFRRMLELTGKANMTEIWPEARTYIHGGVGFKPYRKQFEQLFPRADFLFQETYNASEGFFAAQDLFDTDQLLLMLDSGIYYEFLPLSELDAQKPIALSLKDIEIGGKYALLITTNAGLWRYMPGDVVEITHKDPFRIKIVGRTKHFINAFGEEVIVDNTDKALADTCELCDAKIEEYTVAPIFFHGGQKARHEWAIEFSIPPKDLNNFTHLLDHNLQQLNSDYQAKRYKGLALDYPKIDMVPRGTFHQWMKTHGKYGAQNKVPRLSNSRQYIDDILSINV